MKGLKDKKVLITGATSGIGRAIAIRFAEEGAHVGINYHKGGDELTETDKLVHEAMQECLRSVDECGVTRILVQADVSKEDDVSRMFAEVIAKLGGIDVLINNAGIQIQGESDKIAIDDFDRVLGVNLRGAYLCALYHREQAGSHRQRLQRAPDHPQAILRQLLDQQGRHAEPDADAGARIRGQENPCERHRAGGDGDADQQGLGHRPEEACRGRAAHPDGTRGDRRGDGGGDGLSCL